MAVLTAAELIAAWERNGGPASSAELAAAIALAESGGDSAVIDNTVATSKPGYHAPSPGAQPEYSIGLWQINELAHPSYSEAYLLTVDGNADAAVAISDAGKSFRAWSTYTSGAYKPFLAKIQAATSGPPAPVTGGIAGTAPSALGGWAHLQTAVNGALPFSVIHGRSVLAAARRALSEAAKVG